MQVQVAREVPIYRVQQPHRPQADVLLPGCRLAMNLTTFLFGTPLRSDAEAEEHIGPLQGIPVLGLDALGSASYGPEAALTVLLVAGTGRGAGHRGPAGAVATAGRGARPWPAPI